MSTRGVDGNGSVPPEREKAWLARVVVTPKAGVNDPEGEAIRGGLASLGYQAVERVRAGRYFEVTVSAPDRHAAASTVGEMCDRLLANPVIESYEVTVDEHASAATTMEAQ